VESGKLATGDKFRYVVCAFPHTEPAAAEGRRPRLAVDPVSETIDPDSRPLEDYLGRSEAIGVGEGRMPVFVAAEVLAEAEEMFRSVGAVETGGILLGKLHRDPDAGLFLEITAQIPARHAEQELSRLTFTPDTWTAVDAARALRGQGEMYVGWWHSHPAAHWCDECPEEKRSKCAAAGKLSGDFFSSYDVALHRAVFPRAYSMALVISDSCAAAEGPAWKAYGWEQGMVLPRGFHVYRAAGAIGKAPTAAQ